MPIKHKRLLREAFSKINIIEELLTKVDTKLKNNPY